MLYHYFYKDCINKLLKMLNLTQQSFDLFQVEDGVVNLAQTLQNQLFLHRQALSQKKQFNLQSTTNGSTAFITATETRDEQYQGIMTQKDNGQINGWIPVQSIDIQLKSEVIEYHQSQFAASCSADNLQFGLDCQQIVTKTNSNQKIEKNDSKNVPKGMMKAFAHMILDKKPQNLKILLRYFQCAGLNFQHYKLFAKKIRNSPKISIGQIRQMLLTSQYAETTRKLGFHFIRKTFLHHIFNSKMEKRHIHLKYIQRWRQIFENPDQFTSLK